MSKEEVVKEKTECEKELKEAKDTTKKEETKQEETTKEEIKKEEKKNTVETRSCVGTYSGQGAVSQDAQTGKNTIGTITIELKEDGTYKLEKENANGDSCKYTIIENALLLKTAPHICGPGSDCSAKYTEYLNISDDCSKISWGYGSYFFDPNFELTK